MKEFFQKNKKLLIIIFLIILLLGIGTAVYFIFFNNSNSTTTDNVAEQTETTEVTPMPEYDEKSSSEAIATTYNIAKQWASDSKLYGCSGLTLSSVQFPDVTYEFLGADQGKFSQWLCEYYSDSKNASMIYVYDEGVVDDDSEAIDAGEYGYLSYGSVNYPSDPTSIVDSADIYSKIAGDIDLESNYINMYLGDTTDYGYVWYVNENSRTEVDDYGINVIVKTYVFDLDGDSITVTTDDVY